MVGTLYGNTGGELLNNGKLATDKENMEKQMIREDAQMVRIDKGFKEVLGLSQMEDGKITEVIYDVEVCVFKSGAKKKDFEDCRPIIVIKGSKNN